MKKEFVELKDNAKLLADVLEQYTEAKDEFNLNLDITSVDGLANYYDEECQNAYDVAKNFFMINSDVLEAATVIKKEHPRYGEPRFKATLATSIIESREVSFEEAAELVNIYVALDKAGYNNVLVLEAQVADIANKVNANGEEILRQSKEACVKAGKSVATAVGNFARPYGEVAKGQLTEASVKAKGLVNKGTKSLIKALGKLEERTK